MLSYSLFPCESFDDLDSHLALAVPTSEAGRARLVELARRAREAFENGNARLAGDGLCLLEGQVSSSLARSLAPRSAEIVSTCIASMFLAVSRRLSPFDVLDPDEEKLMRSADRRLAASSNDVRVRVDDSKKRLAIVLPRSAGTFLISRVETSLKDSAVLRTRSISSRESSSIDKRSFLVHRTSSLFPLPSSLI